MTQRSLIWRGLAVSILAQLLSLSFISTASADNHQCVGESQKAGFVVSLSADVKVIPKGMTKARNYNAPTDFSDENQKRVICEGDTIQTGINSNAVVSLINREQPGQPDMRISIESNSVFTVNQFTESLSPARITPAVSQVAATEFNALDSAIDYCKETINKAWLYLEQGAIHIFTQQPQSLNINTPYMNASVEGTEFTVTVGKETVGGENLGANATLVAVNEGKVGVCNEYGVGKLNQGESAYATQGNPPVLNKVIPDNAVHWALYYPRLNPEQTGAKPSAIEAYELLKNGNVEKAIGLLENQTDDFSQALKVTVAVTQNDRVTAQELADQALVDNPNSAPLLLAKSYSQQADFDLKGALASVELASISDPDSVIILTRLAELQQINGQSKEALVSANSAVVKDDKISRTHSVLGFIELSKFNIDKAKESFNTAIAIDEYDPLPRLGLGLALIRQNDVDVGLDNIADAVILDPLDSILRSYFGKTYAEVNLSQQALDQYQLAQDFDPKDPTPNLYKAFLYQSINQPTKALDQLQKSIDKNGNRAVYRSSPNLDEDLATRSASAARIYDELGFDQLTVLEGAKSLAHDPGNYSAHRLMADAYLNRPRHEIARVSELLQSQIRQPLNNNPAQVQLADSRLGAFRDSGPFDVSFNEFSRLYTKEGFSGRVGLVAGENSTHGEEVQVSNLTGNTSFTVTGYNFETDGGRENADEDNELFNFFVQHQLTDKTNIQAEYRGIDIAEGDDVFRFDRDDFNPNLDRNIDITNYRLSLYHQFNQNNELLLNLNKERLKDDRKNVEFFSPDEFLDRLADVNSELFELQYNFYNESVNIISGINYANQDRFDRSFMGDRIFRMSETDVRHTNTYVYTYPSFFNDKLNFTVGASYDDLDDPDFATDRLNPKFGMIWNFTSNTTFRFATFDTIKRTLAADQTLEPTNIAGFNQFYDDFDATETTVYGLGLDHVLSYSNNSATSKNTMIGFEWIQRDLSIPGFIFDPVVDDFTLQSGEISEDQYRGYLYVPFDNLALSASIEREDFDRVLFFELDEGILDLETWRFGLGAKYFFNNGWYISTDAFYVKQSGNLFDRLFFEEFEAKDDFWLADLEIGYRISPGELPMGLNGLIKLKIDNLFDSNFNYLDTVPFNPRFSYERAVFLQAEFSF